MVDIAFGPEPGQRPNMSNTREAYLEMVRRKRMYGGILLVLFAALLASGWMLADERNAGGFWNGLPMLGADVGGVLATVPAFALTFLALRGR